MQLRPLCEIQISDNSVERNSPAHKVRNSRGRNRNDDIHGYFQSRNQEFPPPPLLRLRAPGQRRSQRAAAADATPVALIRLWNLGCSRRSYNNPTAGKQDSSRRWMQCRRPITLPQSILGNAFSSPYITARSRDISTGIFDSGSDSDTRRSTRMGRNSNRRAAKFAKEREEEGWFLD